MAKNLFKLKNIDGSEAFKVEDQGDGTSLLYIDGTAVTSTAAELNILDGVTSSAAELNILDGVLATTAEINRAADVSTRLVSVGGTSLAGTVLAHSDKVILLDHSAAESTVTLPDATGSGAVFRFIVAAVNTNNHIIKSTTAASLLKGMVVCSEAGGDEAIFRAGASDDKITLNGTTSGGAAVGDYVELVDIAANVYAVRGMLTTSGCEVTPFGSSD